MSSQDRGLNFVQIKVGELEAVPGDTGHSTGANLISSVHCTFYYISTQAIVLSTGPIFNAIYSSDILTIHQIIALFQIATCIDISVNRMIRCHLAHQRQAGG